MYWDQAYYTEVYFCLDRPKSRCLHHPPEPTFCVFCVEPTKADTAIIDYLPLSESRPNWKSPFVKYTHSMRAFHHQSKERLNLSLHKHFRIFRFLSQRDAGSAPEHFLKTKFMIRTNPSYMVRAGHYPSSECVCFKVERDKSKVVP